MAKINRYTGNLQAFASAAPGTERTIFGSVSQANDLNSQITANFLRGWGIVGPSDQPSLEDFNGAMYTHGQLLAYLHQIGIPEYAAAQEYHFGSMCNVNGVIYTSIVNNNTGNTPAPGSAQWTSTTFGRLLRVRTFTSGATYTPLGDVGAILVRLVGGGGGGGGATATTAGQISFGTGGSSGSYGEGFFTTFPASMAVVVGAAGAGVTGANGTPGGASSVGSLISVNGGSNGGVFGPVGPPIAGLVVPSGVSITGAYLALPSEAASIAYVASTVIGFSGGGGNGKLGAGGTPLNAAGTGQVGRGFGAGGGGAISFASQPAASGGGNGSAGIVIIEEYSK